MRGLLICAALIGCACASSDTQFAVKGGHSNFQYKGGDYSRFFNNTQPAYGSHTNVPAVNAEVGVCYIEVPTATLVRDPAHVPTGNGSRPDLSRIRTCCQGFKRNIYNHRLCEPACTKECVNGLCSAPDTCSCFPDHVKNLAGFCVATCPIGCQNGHCAGGECLCREGFKLDIDGRFCIPSCRANCGGMGNCTAPNTCECKPGYKSTPDGSCHSASTGCTGPACERPSPTTQCPYGYIFRNMICEPQCNPECGSNSRCISPNTCSTYGTVHTIPPFQIPQQPSNGPQQTNTNYYNPNQNSQYPYPSNQNSSPAYPQNQSTLKPMTLHGQNTTQNSVYSMYPNGTLVRPDHNGPNSPNQPTNRPVPTEHGTSSTYPSQYPQQPSYITHNITYPSQPLYPGNQVQPQYPNHQGNYPHTQNNLYPSLPNNDNSHHTPGQPSQVEMIPYGQHGGQNPQYPSNQNGLSPNNPNQQGYPQYPSNHQGANSTYPDHQQQGGHNPQYPYQFGTNTYPGQQGQYPQNTLNQFGNSTYPSQQGGYNPHPNQGNNPSQHHQGYNPYGGQSGSNVPDYQQSSMNSLCSEPCVNGVCIDFNKCRCNPGYVQDEHDSSGNRCKPHCPGGCPNGYCSVPYTCACDEGYYKDTSVKGRALCVKRIR